MYQELADTLLCTFNAWLETFGIRDQRWQDFYYHAVFLGHLELATDWLRSRQTLTARIDPWGEPVTFMRLLP